MKYKVITSKRFEKDLKRCQTTLIITGAHGANKM